ncbi:MAG: phosphodiester glycosidase family protein [Rubrivivax sp.]|nr:phosphodiester glycosidase family protein [Rubrivivax sp.]
MLAPLLALLAGCASVPPGPSPGPAPAHRHERIEPWPGAVLHQVWLDLTAAGWRLQVTAHESRGQTLPEMPAATVAAVAINASFFDREFTPRGHTVSDGLPWPKVLVPQTSPLLACDRVQHCRIVFEPDAAAPPADGHTVVAGTPWLVRGGLARGRDDDKRCESLCARTHPRTAVGLDATGRRLLIVLAEGRRDGVPGVTLAQLAEFMRGQGVHDAINLDGGGSSALLIDGHSAMARPANEPAQRRVANGLLWRHEGRP